MTSVCVTIDREDGSQTWKHTGFCGKDYGAYVVDSTLADGTFDYIGDAVKFEVRSSKDPKEFFKTITHGTNYLDDDPDGELIGAILLLILGSILIAITFYRIMRYLVKYSFLRKYFQSREQLYRYSDNIQITDYNTR